MIVIMQDTQPQVPLLSHGQDDALPGAARSDVRSRSGLCAGQ